MMFRFVALIVFFIACVFYTLDFYRIKALNVCEVHTEHSIFNMKTKRLFSIVLFLQTTAHAFLIGSGTGNAERKA